MFGSAPISDNWNRFAAVNDEFSVIHMDDAGGHRAGFPTAIGMGYLLWSYLHNVLREWLGDQGRIVQASCQLRAPNLRGQTVSARATVVRVTGSDDGTQVELDLWVESDEPVTLCRGQAVVMLGLAGPGRIAG